MKRFILGTLIFTIFTILTILMYAVGFSDNVVIYYPRYKYWAAGSVDLGYSSWEIIASESNPTSVSEAFSYTVTRTTIWRWNIHISLSLLGISGGVSGKTSVTENINTTIPPFEKWNLYKRTHTVDYTYEYQEGEIIQYNNNPPFWNATAAPVSFDKVVTDLEYEDDFTPSY